MRLFITCPSLVPHGGIRVILEWASRLARRHTVFVRVDHMVGRTCSWFDTGRARIVRDDRMLSQCDTLVVTSPHGVRYLGDPRSPRRRFVFMQMLEHLFRPTDVAWQRACRAFYLADAPMVAISRWNVEEVRAMGRRGPVHYVGNGVNLADFPLRTLGDAEERLRTVLVEGWAPNNPTKDRDRLAVRLARELKARGIRVLAYSQGAADHAEALDEYHRLPSLARLNELYSRAGLLLKASVFDARSTSPLEAMTKGCVTVRALDRGDDDLVHEENCLRGPYDYETFRANTFRLLDDHALRRRLAQAGQEYVRTFTWDYWMETIEGVLEGRAPQDAEKGANSRPAPGVGLGIGQGPHGASRGLLGLYGGNS